MAILMFNYRDFVDTLNTNSLLIISQPVKFEAYGHDVAIGEIPVHFGSVGLSSSSWI